MVVLLVRPLTWRRWLTGLAAGMGWLIIWYAPIPLWGGALLLLAILWGMMQPAFFAPSWRA